jgi:hypothetical protein
MNVAEVFDCVNHELLIVKLHYYGIQGTVDNWFRSYLSKNKKLKIFTEIFLSMGDSKMWGSQWSIFRAFAFHNMYK